MSRVERKRPEVPNLVPAVEAIDIGARKSGTPDVPQSVTPVVRESGSTGSRHSGTTEVPKYLTMERLDARLRRDQVTALSELRNRVARDREDKSERITPSTLLRVAVDLLLSRGDRLAGDTETALRESVTADLR